MRDCIPNDHCRQVSPRYFVKNLIKPEEGKKVLDVGCGTGRSRKLFHEFDDSVKWVGVDIEDSPEVRARTGNGDYFYSYDGVNLPFEDEEFDIVFSQQVFEHVRYPESLLQEINRVLKKGGAFIGSVSTLEPYHSFSFWNYTPYGWYVLLADAGLKPIEFRPGIDGISLIRRQYEGLREEHNSWFVKSPINEEIDEWLKTTRQSIAKGNLRKLQFCGHLVFYGLKP